MGKKNIGIWIRVSSTMQVEKESHIHHEMRAKKFAKSRGYNIVEIYRLEALSGKSVMGYPETKRMLADIKSRKITGLVFSKIARLARNTRELIEISEIFKEYDADLISMDMSIDTSTSIGRHFFRQMSSMAEWEREMIAERISASVQTRAQLGKQLGGQAPFGYSYVDKRLAINEEEAPIRKLMYELFIEHRRYKTVARLLNEKGYRTRNGNKFTDSTIKRLLINPVSKGLQVMNYSKSTDKGTKELKPKKDWVFNKVDAIVSVELWDKVNNIIQDISKKNKRVLNTKVHLFTGYIFCECDSEKSRMYTRSSNDNYVCPVCKNKIHKEDIETIFKEELYSYTISEKEINGYFSKLEKVVADKEKQLASLKKEQESLNKEIENLLLLHNQGQIKTEAFQTYHEKPYKQLIQIEQSISDLEKEISGFSKNENTSKRIIEEAKNLYEKWDRLTHMQKRNIIEIITEKIIIGTEDVEINLYRILPDSNMNSSFELGTNGQHYLYGVMRTSKRALTHQT